VRSFVPESPPAALFPAVAEEIRRAHATYASALEGHPLSFALFKQAPWHQQNSLSLERSQVTMRSPYLDTGFVKTLFRAPGSATMSNEMSMRLIGDGNPGLLTIPTDRGRDGTNTLKEWLAAARHDFTFKAEYAFDSGMPPWMAPLERALEPFKLERFFRGRHRMTAFRAWYRGPLAPYVREMLLDRRSLARPYVDAKMVERTVQSHIRGDGNHTIGIHRLLRLELACRQFVDGAV
jgi:asparagine synthase (glutamine-hydrolysing)